MDRLAALVIGATGAVGGALVWELLESLRWTGVVALVRRQVDMFDGYPERSKLQLAVIDLSNLEEETRALAQGCTAAFCTMGIGQPRKVSDEEFWRVDVEYAGAFARGAASAGVSHLTLLSSIGANRASRTGYLRVKGAAETAVTEPGFQRTSLFRPSLLVTRESRYGLQDRITQALFPILSPLLPRRYHQIRVEDLARAMRINAERDGRGVEVLSYRDFLALLEAA